MGFFDKKKTIILLSKESDTYKPKIGRPRKYETPEEMQGEIEAYFASRTPMNPPTLSSLALYLGYMDRQSLYDAEVRPEFACTIKRARARIIAFGEQQLFTNPKPTGAIFFLKNCGYSDRKEIEISGSLEINSLTPEERKARIDELEKKRHAET